MIIDRSSIFVDREIVRDGRGTSFLAVLRGAAMLGPGKGGSEGAPNPIKMYRADVSGENRQVTPWFWPRLTTGVP